ncbi:MAG: tetratricopeptide repeat protein [Candidatus Colwellbacteria bacterium]
MQPSGISPKRDSSNPPNLAQAAITAALTSNWDEAITLNKKILRDTESDIEAMNRLARAYCCLEQYPKALKIYKKVLELDPFNMIAVKNMEKMSKYNGKGKTSGHSNSATPGTNAHTNSHTQINLSKIFLDEPGKTKLVGLLNLAAPSTLASLNCGDKVILNPKNHAVTVLSEEGTYLGAFPDDIAHRILSFISGGNKYEAYVKSSSIRNLTIFVRELLRSPKLANQPTFQSRVNFFEEASR